MDLPGLGATVVHRRVGDFHEGGLLENEGQRGERYLPSLGATGVHHANPTIKSPNDVNLGYTIIVSCVWKVVQENKRILTFIIPTSGLSQLGHRFTWLRFRRTGLLTNSRHARSGSGSGSATAPLPPV